MKKTILSIAIVAVGLLGASCGNKPSTSNAEASDSEKQQTEQTEQAAGAEGFKTHEFNNFSISVPEEFTTSSDASSDFTSFSSEATLKLDNGEETTSSAHIDASFMSDGAKPAQAKETAATMKSSQEAAGETCDEPVIDGNIILMRHYHDSGEGYKVITWRWWIVSEDGKNVAGNIYYPETQAKYYDAIVTPMVKSIKIK